MHVHGRLYTVSLTRALTYCIDGDKTEFYAHRALRLPGNGTSVLEAQQPTDGEHLVWREVTHFNRFWKLGMEGRYGVASLADAPLIRLFLSLMRLSSGGYKHSSGRQAIL